MWPLRDSRRRRENDAQFRVFPAFCGGGRERGKPITHGRPQANTLVHCIRTLSYEIMASSHYHRTSSRATLDRMSAVFGSRVVAVVAYLSEDPQSISSVRPRYSGVVPSGTAADRSLIQLQD